MRFILTLLMIVVGMASYSQIPSNGLVAWYPFNGNANDESGGGRNGIVYNAQLSSDRNGNPNSAYLFDGMSAFIELPPFPEYDETNQISISVWVRIMGYNSNMNCNEGCAQFIVSRQNDFSHGHFKISILENAGLTSFSCQVSPISGSAIASSPVVREFPMTSWVHLTCTYDGSRIKFYEDGQLVSTTIYNQNIGANSLPILIGKHYYPQAFPYFVNGFIDDIAFYNRALSASEVTQLYNSNVVTGCTDIAACNYNALANVNDNSCSYPLTNYNCSGNCNNDLDGDGVCDELEVNGCTDSTANNFNSLATENDGTCIPLLNCNITASATNLCIGESVDLSIRTTGGAGSSSQLPVNLQQGLMAYYPFNGNANDESGNGNSGTVNGATLTTDRFGNEISAYYFSGINSYVEVPHSQSLAIDSDITLSVWIKPEGILENNSATIFTKGTQGSFWNYGLNLGGGVASTYPSFLYTDYTIGSMVEVQLNTWSNITVVISESQNSFNLYLNGVLLGNIQNLVSNSIMSDFSNVINSCCSSPLTIGRNGASYGAPFLGAVDDLLIYNRALSPTEIQELHTAQSYAWNTGDTNNSVTVNPTTNTTYSCTVTQDNQTCTASIDITVNPAVTNSISATIIEGETYTLGTQTLTTAGTYTEVFTSAAGCDSTVTLTLAVEPLLTCNITAPITTLCAGESVNLSISTSGGAGSSSQLPTNLQQGLVAYYPFNGNANDESGNGFNGVVSGELPYVSDRWGNSASAISFDAENCNSQVQATINDQLISGSLSISFWVNRQGSVCENPRYFASYFSQVGILNNTNGHFQIIENASGFSINHVVGDGVVSASDYESIENQWTLISYVNDGIHGYFYKNGILFSEVNNSSNANITLGNLIILGHLGNSWASGVTAFLGHMDDVMIWGRALSNNEIQQLYTSQSYAWSNGATTNTITVAPTTNTTYSCTVTQGNQTCTASIDITVNPTVISTINASIIDGESYTLGAQTLTTAGTYTENFTSNSGCDSIVTLNLSVIPLLTCEITSNSTSICSGEELTLNISSNVDDILAVGESTFNGQGYIQFPNTGLTGSTSRTITYKARTSSQNIMSVLNYGGAAGNGTGLVELGMNLDMWFGAGSGYCDSITKGVSFFSNSHSVNIGKTVFDNQWHTITYVMGENNNFAFSAIKVYVDGILVSQGQNNTPFCGHNWGGWQYNTIDGPLTIGKPSAFNPYASKFVGSIADVAMWSRALSSSEVLSLNAQSPSIISNGLAHYYPLTGGTPIDVVTGATGQVLGLSTSNINWSTGATSASIIVNPTSNTSYSCTVNAGPQTCTASVDITVSPQQTFYADADGDGFGNPQLVVTNCNQPAGYVTDNTDCNDNDATIYVASTESCNGLDDNCDGQVDEGLTLGSVTATSVTTALYPTCSGNALKSANLNNGVNSSIIDGNGLDLWYSMTAQYNTLRASLSAAFGDNEIRLYSYNNGCFELMETEHEVYTTTFLGTGNQVLITDDLLVGQTYYIAVHNISGPINSSAKMCFNHFVGSTCDHYYSNNTGIYNNVCTSFKAQYKGNATNYIFDILSATQNNANLNITPWSYTTTTANSVVPRLGTIFPVNMSNAAKVYTLRIPVIYAIPDAAGNYTSITANATTTCTVTLNAELPIALRAADRCPNTKTTTSSISVDRTICGAQRYEWEFTQQLPSVQSPMTVLGGLNTTVFFLNNVPGMGTGKTYNVRVRPIHANGEVGNWGTAQCLKTGTAGMAMQSESDDESGVWANNYSPRQAVTLYPNPTSNGHFTLMTSSTEDEVRQIAILDITGKIVFQSQVVMNGNAVDVEFGDLATGMYVVMVGEERLRLIVE